LKSISLGCGGGISLFVFASLLSSHQNDPGRGRRRQPSSPLLNFSKFSRNLET
jgi:hypothetical protein